MKEVMIADDNQNFISSCEKFLAKDKNINIIAVTTDGLTTLETYLNLKPDILLLDLNLPIMSGIDVINHLTAIQEEKSLCNIIVITGSDKYRKQLINTLKIFKIIQKPCDFIDILLSIHEIEAVKRKNNIDVNKINSLMGKLNFNLSAKGTKYLIDAIIIANNNMNLIYNLNSLFTYVAKKNNTNANFIKWSIANSLSSMNRFVDKEMLYSLFDEYDGRNLTPKYFINMALSYIKNLPN